MGRTHTVVIGGGIAGLSVAWPLAEAGRRVTVLEREAAWGAHSSARNAQIWLPVDDDATTGPLARESADRMSALIGAEEGWLRRSGAVALLEAGADPSALHQGAEKGGVTVRPLDRAALREASPVVEEAQGELAGYAVDGAGVLDPHVMMTALLGACRDAGVALRTGAAVRAIEATPAVRAVALADGGQIDCDEVVIAAGAWARVLGQSVGLDVPIVPLRRHLVLLDADPRAAGTIVWRFAEPGVYWRPESGGVLASPCDEEPFDACLPASDPRALERLAEVLAPVAPALVEAPVRTRWACLRSYAHDRELVLGPDPRVPGLGWLAGLGGRGMTVGVGAGALCARAMLGEGSSLLERIRADRVQPSEMTTP